MYFKQTLKRLLLLTSSRLYTARFLGELNTYNHNSKLARRCNQRDVFWTRHQLGEENNQLLTMEKGKVEQTHAEYNADSM